MEKAYAQALYDLSQKPHADKKAVVEGLLSVLRADNRVKLLPAILREFKRLEAQGSRYAPHVEVAHADEKTAALAAAAKEGIEVSHATVNPALIRGWRARTGSTLVDRSGKRMLIDLYRNITAN